MRKAKQHSPRAGFSLLETMIAISAVLFCLLGYSRTVVDSIRAGKSEREAALALAAARQVVSELQATPFDELFRHYNQTAADDPGPGASPGPFFTVNGLEPVAGAAAVGQVIMPVVANGGVEEVREDIVNPRLGMQRDLNGDQVIDAADHSGDYMIMPVLVRLRWMGSGGMGTLEFRTSIVSF